MKNRKYSITASFLLLAAACFMNGCRISKDDPIVTINDKKLYMADFLYQIYTIEEEGNRLEEYYQNNLGYSYWDYEFEGKTMREMAKNSVITQVVMDEILADQAQQKEISLSDKEAEQMDDDIAQLYADISEEKFDSIGLTRKVLTEALGKVSLSDKYHSQIIENLKIDTEAIRDSIDKEQYREYKTECLYSATVSTEEDMITPLSMDEKETAYSDITKALQWINDGMGFDEILNKDDRLTYSSRKFVFGDSLYEDTYQKEAIILNNGEYSNIVATDYGYYIIHMLDCYSMDQYEQAVEDAITAEEEKQFAEIYNEIKKQYNITINFEDWDPITIGSITKFKN